VIDGGASPIRGFFMIGENSLKRLDGVGDQWVKGKNLYFPLVKRDSTSETTIYIHNPTDTPTTVTLTWIGQEGNTISQALVSILAHGSMVRPVGHLFPTSSAVDGYLRVVSGQEVTGCLLHADAETFVALPAVPPALVQTLFAPHFYVPAQGGGTELRLVNTESVTVSVRVRAYKDGTHELLGDTSHDIPAGAIWVTDLGTLMHLPLQSLGEDQAYTGYLQLDVRTPMIYQPAWVVGAVVFSGNNHKFAAALPLVEQGYRETLIPHVAQSDAFRVFTGLAVLNAGGEPADVTVFALSPLGEESGRQEFTLQPGERAVDLLNGPVFFGAEFSQNGGYLRISSTQPLVSFALFGDSGLAYMAAIGGQSMDQ
jgi:hypothetical protein